jgi:hypothetical protein
MLGGSVPARNGATQSGSGALPKMRAVIGSTQAAFEFACRSRARERQARQDRKLDAGIGGGALVEGVDERDGLAGADRSAEHDAAADPRDCLFDAVLDVSRTAVACARSWARL